MDRQLIEDNYSVETLKMLGCNNEYSTSNAIRIINNYKRITNKLGIEIATKIIVNLLIYADKRDLRYLYEKIFCHVENNHNMFGCGFFISLFISTKLEHLEDLNNYKLKDMSSSVIDRMVNKDTSYNCLSLDEFNKSNDVYYEMFSTFLKDVSFRVTADCSYIYSVSIDDCMTMLESTVKIINRNTNIFPQEPIDEYCKYNKLQEFAELSTDSAVLDFEIEYITETIDADKVNTNRTIREINRTVCRLLDTIDIEYDEGIIPIENIQEDLENMFSELNNSIVDSCNSNCEIIDEMTPIMCDVEITIYNMISIRLVYEAIIRIVLREFDNEKDAVTSFKDLLILTSYVSVILCKGRNTDVYPSLQTV